MNILEDIQNCPVEWKELGEVCSVNKGKQLNKNLLIDDGLYPAYNGGQTYSGRTNDYNVEANTIIVSQGGASAGFVNFVETKFWANAHCYYILPDETQLKNRFVYHFLKMNQIYLMDFQHGAGIPALKSDKLTKLLIPVPPIKIQDKIVQILDKFTNYVTELTSEFTSRKKQYSFYRDKLLLFEDDVYQVEWKTLGEVAENLDNMRKPVAKGGRSLGIYPYYGASGIVDYVDSFIFDGDYLLISEDGANLVVRKTPIAFSISGKTWVNNHAHVLKFDNIINQKFVNYYLNYLDLSPYITGAAQPKLNQQNLNNIKIPYPSLEIQSRIVQVLDNFDMVCNDLNIGLPKEIELRQKQYEYFREKLLTFVAEGEYTDSTVQYRQDIIRLLNWVFGPIRVKLGQIVNLQRGKRLVRQQLATTGSFPVYQNSLTPLGYYTESNRVKNTSFVICAGAAGEIGYSAMDFWAADDVYTLETSDNISDKFMYYVLLSKQDRLKSQVRKASIPRLSKDAIDKMTFYLPSITEQERIVSILDNFNTLTNSLSEGLPKEIELRQKQYEYWREQLLNFTR